MTLESTLTKIHYEGNGITREFPLPFALLSEEHVRVIHIGADTVQQTLSDGFAVCDRALGTPYILYPVDAELPALPVGERLTFLRVLPLVQQTGLENGGAMDAEALETQFDIITMQIQQLAEELERTPKLSPASLDTSLTVNTLYQQLETIRAQAELAAQRAEAVADDKTLFEGIRNLAATWEETQGKTLGEVLVLPVQYIPGRNVLSLYADGVLCYPAGEQGNGGEQDILQYEEAGSDLSCEVRLLFAVPKGTVWHARVVASNLTMIAKEEFEEAVKQANRLQGLTKEATRLLGLLQDSPAGAADRKRTATLFPAGVHAACPAGEVFPVPPYTVGAGELVSNCKIFYKNIYSPKPRSMYGSSCAKDYSHG